MSKPSERIEVLAKSFEGVFGPIDSRIGAIIAYLDEQAAVPPANAPKRPPPLSAEVRAARDAVRSRDQFEASAVRNHAAVMRRATQIAELTAERDALTALNAKREELLLAANERVTELEAEREHGVNRKRQQDQREAILLDDLLEEQHAHEVTKRELEEAQSLLALSELHRAEAERTIAGMRAVVEAANMLLASRKDPDALLAEGSWTKELERRLDALSALAKPAAAELLHDRIPTDEGPARAAKSVRVPAEAVAAEPREIRVGSTSADVLSHDGTVRVLGVRITYDWGDNVRAKLRKSSS